MREKILNNLLSKVQGNREIDLDKCVKRLQLLETPLCGKLKTGQDQEKSSLPFQKIWNGDQNIVFEIQFFKCKTSVPFLTSFLTIE